MCLGVFVLFGIVLVICVLASLFGIRRALVEAGKVNRVVYARATAERMKRSEYKDSVGPIEATGHFGVASVGDPNEQVSDYARKTGKRVAQLAQKISK